MSRKKEIKSLQEWSPSVGSNRNRQESFLWQHCNRALISWPRTVERQAGHLRLVLRGSNRDLWGEKTATVFSQKLHLNSKHSRNTLHVVFLCSSFSCPALCYVPFLLKAPYEWQEERLKHFWAIQIHLGKRFISYNGRVLQRQMMSCWVAPYGLLGALLASSWVWPYSTSHCSQENSAGLFASSCSAPGMRVWGQK